MEAKAEEANRELQRLNQEREKMIKDLESKINKGES